MFRKLGDSFMFQFQNMDSGLQTDLGHGPLPPSDLDPDCSASVTSSCSSSCSDPSVLPERVRPLLKPPTLKSKSRGVKQAILQAVEVLENENEELKTANCELETENESLRAENMKLRAQLEESKRNGILWTQKITSLQLELENVSQTIEDLKQEKLKFEKETECVRLHLRERNNIERNLIDENAKFVRQLDNYKRDLQQKENENKQLANDLKLIRKQLESRDRKNYSDRGIELRQEIELLKSEKRDLCNVREDLDKSNKKLRSEISRLENQLDDRVSELKNENRRHSLLTKEFNSLLEENNHLKLQLRRRQQAAPTGASPPAAVSKTSDTNSVSESTLSLVSSSSDTALNTYRGPRDQQRAVTPRLTYSRQETKLSTDSLPQLSPNGSKQWRP